MLLTGGLIILGLLALYLIFIMEKSLFLDMRKKGNPIFFGYILLSSITLFLLVFGPTNLYYFALLMRYAYWLIADSSKDVA